MGKFLFATLGSLGDLHPCMGVARELKSRGHSVTIGTSPYYADYIRNAGFRFAPVRPDLKPSEPELLKILFDARRGAEHLHKKVIFPSVRDTTLDLVAEARNADVLFTSILFYGAPVLSKITNRPWASGLLSPMALFSGHEPAVIAAIPALAKMTWLPPAAHRAIIHGLFRMSDSWAKPLHDLRKEYGLPRLNGFFSSYYSPYKTLCLWSDLFGAPQPDWPSSAKTCGFVFYDPKDDVPLAPEVERFASEGEPPLVLTMGSTVVEEAEHYLSLFEKIPALTGKRAIITVGQKNIARYADRSSSQVLFIDYAPYVKLFEKASLVVHQGGVGTTAQAMRSGKPAIILPFVMDQLDNAARIEKRNLGKSLHKKKATPERLAKLILETLSDRALIENCATVGSEIRAENGAAKAASELESLLGGNSKQ